MLSGKLLKAKDRNTKRDIRKELRTLAREERKRQQLAVTDVIKRADVVLTTLTGAFSRKLEGSAFDLVIIDEAAQALEVACWIALLKVCCSLITTSTDVALMVPDILLNIVHVLSSFYLTFLHFFFAFFCFFFSVYEGEPWCHGEAILAI